MAAVAGVLVLAVVGAAVSGTWHLTARRWEWVPPIGAGMTPPALPPQPTARPTPVQTRSVDVGWIGPVAIVLAVLVAAALGWWLWRRYQRSAVERRAEREGGIAVVMPAQVEVPVLRRGVAAAQRHLDEIADPNNAIVAAWLALEAAAATSGVRRQPAETPTEFTLDVLASTAADPRATRELLGLYHRARFSAAGVTREDVAAASRCLVALAASWEALTTEAVTAAVAEAGRGDDGSGSTSR